MKSKGRLIENYEHRKAHVSVPIRFYSDEGVFRAKFNNQIFHDADIRKLRNQLFIAIEQGTSLEWQPVIIVSFGNHFREDIHLVSMSFDREWFAKRADGGWLNAEWDTKVFEPGEERKFGGPSDRFHSASYFSISRYKNGQRVDVNFEIPFTDREYNGTDSYPTYYIAYTEELWATLEALRDTLRKIEQRIIDVLGNERKRLELITTITNRMLGTGTP